MNQIKFFLSVFTAFIIVSCGEDQSSIVEKIRPQEPWVFRSVLDKNPRIITLALNEDLWVAYKTSDCALYKVWKGGVNFDGPVYTTHHGPQPTSIGDAYFVNEIENPWSIVDPSGNHTNVKANYLGHRFANGSVELMYGLNGNIKIYEKVEVGETEAGQRVFERVFTTEGLSKDHALHYKFNVSSIVAKSNIKTNGELAIDKKNEYKFHKLSALDMHATLKLNNQEATFLNILLMPVPTKINPLNMGLLAEGEVSEATPKGIKLIAKNDCKTCHNKTVKTIGPAYVSIAKKYKTTEDNIDLLVSKVINGGTGIWGNQIMNAHPDLQERDAKEMVKYILSLDGKEDKGEGESSDIVLAMVPDTTISPKELIPGAITRIYDIPKVDILPELNSYTSAKYAGVMANFDNISGGDFMDLKDNFALVARGVLLIEDSGDYGFRIWSDDGSKLTLGGLELLDNDGLHGTSFKEATVNLKKGIYPFVLEFFQGAGGKFLSMNWKGPGDDQWKVIPPENIFHNEVLKKSEAKKVLPMANVVQIPGDKNPVAGIHPSFDLYQARPSDFLPKVGGIDFLSNGDMILSTWDAAGSVYRLKNHTSEDPSKIQYKLIAQGLAEPLGVAIKDDRIFVMQKQEITELIDNDGDEVIDEYLTLNDDWGVSANFHEFGFGLEEKDGFLYAALATAIEPGGASTNPQIKDRGKVIKVNIETGELEYMAHGLRTPNGVGKGFNDAIYIADNQGDWLPSSKIVRVDKDAWFGSRSVDFEGTKGMEETQPVVWLPQDEIGNSPSTPLSLNIGPYKNQMIHGEVTHGGVKRVFVEEVEGVTQGALFRFTQGMEAGINRLRWGPDGSLYVGGIGAPGNWGQTGKLWYGLQRIKYNEKPTFEMLAVRVKSNGMEIEFTEPLQKCEGWNTDGYEITQWYYKPTIDYGGPKLGEKALKVKSASVSDDRTKVFLEIEDLKEKHVVHLRLKEKLISENDNDLWTTETWYTLNKLPSEREGNVLPSPCTVADNMLSSNELEDGWELLFDGNKIEHFRTFNKEKAGSSWVIDDNAIHLTTVKNKEGGQHALDGGDIITKETYHDFDFKVDWKISACGNSGIMYNVVESDEYHSVWLTGPEMQVLDNTCHPDTRYVTHRAGDLYDMIETKFVTVNPAGEWNQVRIKSIGGKVDFWLNGYKVVEFEMHNEKWLEMIANSKFKDMPDFGLAKEGHISLQDHSDKVWYKNIKIKRL